MELVLQIGDRVTTTLFEGDQIVSVNQFSKEPGLVDNIYYTIGGLTISGITVLYPVNLTRNRAEDQLYLSTVYVGDVKYTQFMDKLDHLSLSLLAKLMGIELLKVVTPLDLYLQMHKEDDLILLDEYLGGSVLVTVVSMGKVVSITVCETQEVKDVLLSLRSQFDIDKVLFFKEPLREVSNALFSNSKSLHPAELFVISDSLLAAKTKEGTVLDVADQAIPEVKAEPVVVEDYLDTVKISVDSALIIEEEPAKEVEVKSIPKKMKIGLGKSIPKSKSKVVSKKQDVSEKPSAIKKQEKPKKKETKIKELGESIELSGSTEESEDKEVILPPKSKSRGLGFPSKPKKKLKDSDLGSFLDEDDDEFIVGKPKKFKVPASSKDYSGEDNSRENKMAVITLILTLVILGAVYFPSTRLGLVERLDQNVTPEYLKSTSLNLAQATKYNSSADGQYLDIFKKLSAVGGATLVSFSVNHGVINAVVVSDTEQSFQKYKDEMSKSFSVADVSELPLGKKDPVSSVRKQLLLN